MVSTQEKQELVRNIQVRRGKKNQLFFVLFWGFGGFGGLLFGFLVFCFFEEKLVKI